MNKGTVTITLHHYQELLDFKNKVMEGSIISKSDSLDFHTKEECINILTKKISILQKLCEYYEKKYNQVLESRKESFAEIRRLSKFVYERNFFQRLFNLKTSLLK